MISTSAALTSIHALSAEDCAAVTRWSNCASFSLVAEACEAEGELDEEEAAAGENCFAGSGTAISAMAKSKQHFHNAFIIYVHSAMYAMSSSRAGLNQPRRVRTSGVAEDSILRLIAPWPG